MSLNQWKPKSNCSVYCLPLPQGWHGQRWITTWKSWPSVSSSNSELIKFLAQNLPKIDISVKMYRRSSSRFQRSGLPTSKGNRELYLCSFDEKTAKVPWHSPFNISKIILGTKPKSVHVECVSGHTNIQHMFRKPWFHPVQKLRLTDGRWRNTGKRLKRDSVKMIRGY